MRKNTACTARCCSGPITTFTIPNKWPDLTGSDLTGEVYRLWADGELDDMWIPALEAKGFPTQMGFPALLDYYSLFTQPLDDGQVEVQLKLIRIPADKAAAQYPPIPFEELPGDVVTIRVTFTDGQSVTKKVAISFNAQGYAVLELLPA